MSMDFDPYHRWLGIPPSEQPANHYRLLGVPLFEADPEVIRDGAAQRMAHVRTYQLGPHSALSQKILNELGAARACLLAPEAKAAYDQRLRAELSVAKEPRGSDLFADILEPGTPVIVSPVIRRTRSSRPTPALVAAVLGLLTVLSLVVWGFRPAKVAEVARPPALESPEKPSALARQKEGAPTKPPDAQAIPSVPGVPSPAAKPAETTPIAPPPLAVAPFSAAEAREHQRRWAEYLKVPVDTTNSIDMQLVLIPPGEFDMGSTQEQVKQLQEEAKNASQWYIERIPTEAPRHRVRITRPFYLGAHEVTLGQFRQFVQSTGYKTEAEKQGNRAWGMNPATGTIELLPACTWGNPGFAQNEQHPVVAVSWNDAHAFCQWLSGKEGNTHRLPTEAEWEYACRAGTTTRYFGGDNPECLQRYGNVGDVSLKAACPRVPGGVFAWNDAHAYTAPVGSFEPNAFGLYDMHGNAWEWCADFWSPDYYKGSPVSDPAGPLAGVFAVLRGGSWYHDFPECFRCAYRNFHHPDHRYHNLGFRVAKTVTP